VGFEARHTLTPDQPKPGSDTPCNQSFDDPNVVVMVVVALVGLLLLMPLARTVGRAATARASEPLR